MLQANQKSIGVLIVFSFTVNNDKRPSDAGRCATLSWNFMLACQSFTGSEVPSCVLKRKTDKFILRFNCVENTFAIFVAQRNVSVEYFVFFS